MDEAAYAAARSRMIAEQIRARGVRDQRVLDAMNRVPRHLFVPGAERHEAYEDHPIPIGFGQTISQPYIVAFMTEALGVEPSHRVLEIGAGSGYQTAVLAELGATVYAVEVIEALAIRARQLLDELHYANVHLRAGDGYAGWPEHAPYDRIIAAAAPDDIPRAFIDQLVEGGILAIPLGVINQQLHVSRRVGGKQETIGTMPVRFVPMIKKA
ncbi:MAG: protein-L-isoaspartate O-methyltransferase [Acidobacteria bacterium]|nr:MAG: protein-L-isoaspartate O-methyltransferase [Acidobacteriota bacterium]